MDSDLKRHIENCQYARWYPELKKICPRTIILEAPQSFKDYLLADGIYLHESASDDDGTDSQPDDDYQVTVTRPPEDFHASVTRAIADLGGAVAPKLNWSAPKDACWINPTNDMKCISANDIYSLLKSSDYVTHDLTQAFGNGEGAGKITLILREWLELNPSFEFRCFVRNGTVIGITQRDMNYYDFLLPLKAQLEKLLLESCHHVIAKFPDASFVADLYVPKNKRRAWLIDIDPWLETTDSLLFDWDELKNWKGPLDFRILERQDATRGFSSRPHSVNHIPHDFVDMPKKDFTELLETVRDTRKQQLKDDSL